ncbi:hypothetical protein IGI37_001667 [Enterococcus sp. AZ194]
MYIKDVLMILTMVFLLVIFIVFFVPRLGY